MAFLNRIGSLLKQNISKHVSSEFSASNSSLFQAIRSMSTSSKLFVGGLSYSTDEMSLREAFSQYGEVVEARIIMDRETGRSRGFAFITYTSSESASSAIQAFDGQDLHGRRIRVNYATEKPRGGGGFGYGGQGGGFGGGGGFGYGGQSGGYGGNYGRGGYQGGGGYAGGDGGFGGGSGFGGGNQYPSGGYQGGYQSGGSGFGSNSPYPSGGGGGFGGRDNYPSRGGGFGSMDNIPVGDSVSDDVQGDGSYTGTGSKYSANQTGFGGQEAMQGGRQGGLAAENEDFQPDVLDESRRDLLTAENVDVQRELSDDNIIDDIDEGMQSDDVDEGMESAGRDDEQDSPADTRR